MNEWLEHFTAINSNTNQQNYQPTTKYPNAKCRREDRKKAKRIEVVLLLNLKSSTFSMLKKYLHTLHNLNSFFFSYSKTTHNLHLHSLLLSRSLNLVGCTPHSTQLSQYSLLALSIWLPSAPVSIHCSTSFPLSRNDSFSQVQTTLHHAKCSLLQMNI